MSKEPDPRIRKTVALPESMWRDVAAFQEAERIATEGEAVRRLIHAALRAEKRKEKP
jgi:hypothetical protein